MEKELPERLIKLINDHNINKKNQPAFIFGYLIAKLEIAENKLAVDNLTKD